MILRLRPVLLVCALASAFPIHAQQYASGQEAYANRDWEAARRIWSDEAGAGSADALLGLGNLLDFGLTGAPDPEGAFDLYRRAAELGNGEAAFNLAVMLDSGVGTDTDKRAAAGWYSLSAIDDFPRAQYNLGQMYADGEGVPGNGRLAELWLEEAGADIPAARELIADLDTAPGTDLARPEILQAVFVGEGDSAEARLAWASARGPEGSRYRVELTTGNAVPGDRQIVTAETTASAIAMPIAFAPERAILRVLHLTDGDYAASEWTDSTGTLLNVQPTIFVRFEVERDDRRGLGYAERMGASFTRSGAVVSYDQSGADLEESAVLYGYDADAAMATNVADFLPSLAGNAASRQPGLGLAPGEILVRVVFE